jgi:hypothetical protein
VRLDPYCPPSTVTGRDEIFIPELPPSYENQLAEDVQLVGLISPRVVSLA